MEREKRYGAMEEEERRQQKEEIIITTPQPPTADCCMTHGQGSENQLPIYHHSGLELQLRLVEGKE